MKSIARAVFTSVILSSACRSPIRSEAPAQHTRTAESAALGARLDSAVRAQLAQRQAPGAVVALVRGGDTLVFGAYGVRNVDTGQPVERTTVFPIQSITKQFTAAAIMRLVERGKVRLDDTLSRYLPQAAHADSVTVRQLLTHTSGIANYIAAIKDFDADYTPQSMLALVNSRPLDFPPGTRYSYSNSGYYLLGLLIERVSRVPYGTFFKQEFFGPLGMRHTGVCDPRGALVATGHVAGAGGGAPRTRKPWGANIGGADGNLCSTAGDLLRWADALHGGRVLSAAAYRQMTTVATLRDGTPVRTGYGFGSYNQTIAGHHRVSHTGAGAGFQLQLDRYPDDGVTIVVLTNLGDGSTEPLTMALADLLFDRRPGTGMAALLATLRR